MSYAYPMSSPVMTATPYPQNNRPIIEVSGEGNLSAAPNRAIIVLGVITENLSLSAAQRENATATAHVINALVNLNIPKDHIQTISYQIESQYDFKDGTSVFKGYKVTHLLQITIDRVELTGQVVDTAVQNGANFVSSIQFSVANPGLIYNQALSAAVQNAESKAGAIARTLGVTLVRIPLKITEESQNVGAPIPFKAALMVEGAAAPTPIQPGQLEIRATVRTQYTYL